MIEKVLNRIDVERERSAQKLYDFLRIPSISTDPERAADMRAGVEWVHRFLGDCGFKSEIVETAGHPAVVADSGPGPEGAPTVLVYGHYDVQPDGDPDLWQSPAFEPTIRNGQIYARGAADDKGQVFTYFLAVASWIKAAGALPCRVKFLIEGEEEIGSPNLAVVLQRLRDRLACDYVALSDTPRLNETTPAITYGTKGLVYKEINVFGPKQNLHSGSFGGTLTNPANALAKIIDSLRDGDNRVTIAGFYDDVRELTDAEQEMLQQTKFDEAAYLKVTGAPSLHSEKGYSVAQCRWARPTLDVNGLLSGFTGPGASTIIPAKAMGKVSMRLVPDQDPEKIDRAFDDAIKAAVPEGARVEITTHASCAPYLCPVGAPAIGVARQALSEGFGTEPVFIREGGSLPILPLFKEVLGADSLMLGFCDPNCNAHGPNEFFGVSDLYHGTRTAALLLQKLAKLGH